MDWAKNASVAGGLIRGSRRLGSRAFAMGMGMMSGDKVIRSAAMGGMKRGAAAMGMPALMGMGIGAGANFALNSLGNLRRGDPMFAGGMGAAVRGGVGGAMAGGLGFGANKLGRGGSTSRIRRRISRNPAWRSSFWGNGSCPVSSSYNMTPSE